ncbi:MAG: hypothetical protein IT177_01570 [Acidobacteria bacterium]|nr:hypothetical protein [Acidobacteriota bacterium]
MSARPRPLPLDIESHFTRLRALQALAQGVLECASAPDSETLEQPVEFWEGLAYVMEDCRAHLDALQEALVGDTPTAH